ncbi:putative nucleotidyltransferase with HDIG domain [Roseibium hamelinense]|uniref:Putative nucleotidyltransferase with HDIG domain n=1 Tax=Roseibium hamelinense TaxID=150831 RepID=A0A562THN3_9HYPH|nr:HD-GYP domain-containing protein [Roseibium hamelinense]MTI46119.1 HD-GYP domain-containing protein [Roseibium hamelinense]TWI92688.1 putative nucleotidyltransferase with HDIG domain [Roseibium hamelinense]
MVSEQTSRTLRLAELLGALSHALDITEGQPRGHCVRCCWIGIHIGRQIGLPDNDLSDLYYTLLLKDLGCSSNAARICELYLTDDLTFKHDFKTMSDSLPAALRFVLSHTGLKHGFAERVRAIVNILRNGGDIANEMIETRCQRGADIAKQMQFSESVVSGIYGLDEHWNGQGRPNGAKENEIPRFSQIALLAQIVDVFQMNVGPEAALVEVRGRSGTWFDPALVGAFEAVAQNRDFWASLSSEDLEAKVYGLEPAQDVRYVDDSQLDQIAHGFAQVIDSKSPFTAGHSERVTLFTDMIAEQLGYSARDRQLLKRAALLHDIGKLGVSNSVLDKPAKLDDDEWVQIRMHPVYSDEILSRIDAFKDLSPIARGHHERIDGRGYPDGLAGTRISMETRIVTTADIFDALTAERPYRAAMPLPKALGIMEGDIGTAIDPICFKALQSATEQIEADAAA